VLGKQESFPIPGSFLETYLFDSYALFSKGPSSTMTLAARNTMLNALPAPFLLDIAIIFTALSWGLGLYLVEKRVYIFASLAVGCFVCLFGYSVESLGAPLWAVVAAPVPLDLLLLWVCLKKPWKNGGGLPVDLGNLHRYSHTSQCVGSLRLPDSRVETAFMSS
jgi:hypothetical protein